MSTWHWQGRITHCAGCTMGGAPAARGPPIKCRLFYHAVLTFERLKRSDDYKKVVDFWGEEKCTPDSLRKSWLRVWEKGPALHWYWGGAPELLIRPWTLGSRGSLRKLQRSPGQLGAKARKKGRNQTPEISSGDGHWEIVKFWRQWFIMSPAVINHGKHAKIDRPIFVP